MKSAAILITRNIVILYPEARNQQGLRIPTRPFKILDLTAPAEILGQILMDVLDTSSLELPARKRSVANVADALLKEAKLKSWGEAAYGAVEMNDELEVFKFVPGRPRGAGHIGSKKDLLTLPITSELASLGGALLSTINNAKRYAKM